MTTAISLIIVVGAMGTAMVVLAKLGLQTFKIGYSRRERRLAALRAQWATSYQLPVLDYTHSHSRVRMAAPGMSMW